MRDTNVVGLPNIPETISELCQAFTAKANSYLDDIVAINDNKVTFKHVYRKPYHRSPALEEYDKNIFTIQQISYRQTQDKQILYLTEDKLYSLNFNTTVPEVASFRCDEFGRERADTFEYTVEVGFECGEWKEISYEGYLSLYRGYFDPLFAQSRTELLAVLGKKNSYAEKMLINSYSTAKPYSSAIEKCLLQHKVITLMFHPEAETFVKAGYDLITPLWNVPTIADYKRYKALVKPERGSSIFEMLGFDKAICNYLKSASLDKWDTVRKFVKKYPNTKLEALQTMTEMSPYGFKQLVRILSFKYNNKNVFSIDSLANYLRRLDMYQAINTVEALQIIEDYLNVCKKADLEPRIDSDSIKREHDVAVRYLNGLQNEADAKKFNKKYRAEGGAYEKLSAMNYTTKNFIIRALEDYNDLREEAKQQYNCLLGYADKLADGESLIFVMRKVDNPAKSYVSIEVSPSGYVSQKYLSYNRAIEDPKTLKVIDNWFETVVKDKL